MRFLTYWKRGRGGRFELRCFISHSFYLLLGLISWLILQRSFSVSSMFERKGDFTLHITNSLNYSMLSLNCFIKFSAFPVKAKLFKTDKVEWIFMISRMDQKFNRLSNILKINFGLFHLWIGFFMWRFKRLLAIISWFY